MPLEFELVGALFFSLLATSLPVAQWLELSDQCTEVHINKSSFNIINKYSIGYKIAFELE